MNFIKRLISITVFIFCFLTAITELGLLVDGSTAIGDKIYGSIFLFIISFPSFLLAKWLWNTAKKSTPLAPIEVSETTIFNRNPEEPKMVEKLISFLLDDKELDDTKLRLLSLIFLFLSGSMSFFGYTHRILFWNSNLTFQPGLVSSVLAILLTSPLYMRGILKWNKSVYTIVSFVLIVLVFASFIELAMGGNGKSSIITALLAASVVLSWLGIKEVAGVCWILVIAAALISTITNNLILGFYGFIYIVSGFLGLVLHSGLNPGQLLQGIKNEYSLNSVDAAPKFSEGTMPIDIGSLQNSAIEREP